MSILAGMLLLAFGDAVLSSSAAAGRVGGLGTLVAKGVAWFVSPSVPGIPDRRRASSSSSTAAGGAPVSIPGSGGGQAGEVGGRCPPGYRWDAKTQSCVINTAPIGGVFGPVA